MSVSSVAPTPFYHDPERLQIGLPQASADDKATAKAGDKHLSMFAEGDDSPSFWDLLDVVNPLQHIPVVGNLYREATGDQIGVGARLAGGTLFGGPIGLIASAIDCMVEESTGTDAGGHMLALFRDEGQSTPETAPATMLADAPAAPAATAAAPGAPPANVTPAAVKAATESGTVLAGAPVITLPDSKTGGASQPMMFSLDGVQTAETAAAPQKLAAVVPPVAAAPQPVATPTAPTTPTPAVATVQHAAATPAAKPIGTQTARVMPVPQRGTSANAQPLPQVTVPVSNNSARSNVPLTGRTPQATAGVTATGQRAQVTQEALANHPMLPPTDANGQTAAAPDWFTTAWSQALDKYQRANQRNGQGAGSTTSTLE